MKKITSFTINHLLLQPGVYVSRKDPVGGTVVTTFDLRLTSPNEEPVMNTAEMHTIEHLAATFLRNHKDYGSKTVYFGPMGCQTGFYLLVDGSRLDHAGAIALMQEVCRRGADYDGPMPGRSAAECGNYRNLDLALARKLCTEYGAIVQEWTVDKLRY